jgi:hypothetical protein
MSLTALSAFAISRIRSATEPTDAGRAILGCYRLAASPWSATSDTSRLAPFPAVINVQSLSADAVRLNEATQRVDAVTLEAVPRWDRASWAIASADSIRITWFPPSGPTTVTMRLTVRDSVLSGRASRVDGGQEVSSATVSATRVACPVPR